MIPPMKIKYVDRSSKRDRHLSRDGRISTAFCSWYQCGNGTGSTGCLISPRSASLETGTKKLHIRSCRKNEIKMVARNQRMSLFVFFNFWEVMLDAFFNIFFTRVPKYADIIKFDKFTSLKQQMREINGMSLDLSVKIHTDQMLSRISAFI